MPYAMTIEEAISIRGEMWEALNLMKLEASPDPEAKEGRALLERMVSLVDRKILNRGDLAQIQEAMEFADGDIQEAVDGAETLLQAGRSALTPAKINAVHDILSGFKLQKKEFAERSKELEVESREIKRDWDRCYLKFQQLAGPI